MRYENVEHLCQPTIGEKTGEPQVMVVTAPLHFWLTEESGNRRYLVKDRALFRKEEQPPVMLTSEYSNQNAKLTNNGRDLKIPSGKTANISVEACRPAGGFNNMRELRRITFDPKIMGGKPCIRGMRVTVGMIVGMVAEGHSREEILALYPYLEREDIDEALAYAAWRAEELDVPLSQALG